VRRSGRSMNRKVRDRGAEMRLTERTGKLIPETRRGVPIRRQDDVVRRDAKKNVSSLSCYNFDTHERILTFFWAQMLPIK